jgi:predicted GIY-YIG superfamily endonuclease
MSSLPYSRRSEPHVVYRAFDRDGRLLYVGCTIDLFCRMREHRKSKPWYPLVDYWSVSEYPNFHAARSAELAAIRTEGAMHTPVPNGPKRWPTGAEFLRQVAS